MDAPHPDGTSSASHRTIETNKARLELSPDGVTITKSPFRFWDDDLLGNGRRIFRNEQRVTRMLTVDPPPIPVPSRRSSGRRHLTTDAVPGGVMGSKFPEHLQPGDVSDTVALLRRLERYRPRRRWFRRLEPRARLALHLRAGVIDHSEHDLIAAVLPASVPLRFAHGDVTARNLIRRIPDGSLVLIDWEWAGLHPPVYDLAFSGSPSSTSPRRAPRSRQASSTTSGRGSR